jgi:hypothetical protein
MGDYYKIGRVKVREIGPKLFSLTSPFWCWSPRMLVLMNALAEFQRKHDVVTMMWCNDGFFRTALYVVVQ